MSSKKSDIAKNHAILKALVKENGNTSCADCKTSTHPRWASWNLGIFICIRCSGIHRSMGTHISRVKSIDLDSWTDEQVESMLKWGNNKANTYWESKLPNSNYTPDDSKIENFIKTKYDLKKWAASKDIPNPNEIKANSAPVTKSHTPINESGATTRTPTPNNNNKINNNNLLDLEFGLPVSSSTNSLPTSLNPSTQQVQSKRFPTHSSKANIQLQDQTQQRRPQVQAPQVPQPQPTNDRPDLKKSILSLYSTPLAATSTPNFPLQSLSQSQQQHNSSLNFNESNNTSNNGLSGLTFNSSTSSLNNNYSNQWSNVQSQTSQPPIQQVQQQNQWNNSQLNLSNQWSNNNTTTVNSTRTNNGLDDDLFKNVWS
ncbi:hypothetical protein WICMUC_004009 [Wickerhamomyces mucosus]|uniref:Arf-GAP domain-containing protein n=1 Tax=Wickerhamomyces mucosus TaxID=1378264 RepID=A0A9P8PJ52_9ASCO|nr:hypothetical protein WICMUC_004009 [Wickerhamomyces mucosus]